VVEVEVERKGYILLIEIKTKECHITIEIPPDPKVAHYIRGSLLPAIFSYVERYLESARVGE